MAQTKSKRSLAMKKRWAEKKAHEQLNRASTGMDDPTIANVVNTSASGRAVQVSEEDQLKREVNNLRCQIEDSLDHFVQDRDSLRTQLAIVERNIKIRRVQLGID